MRIERVAADVILDLRHRVLRAGLPIEAARFDGDDEPTTRHYAAMDGDGRVVGGVSLIRRPYENEPAWQVRGMAVDPAQRGTGLGAALLRRAEQDVRRDPEAPKRLWCNARAPAVGFYAHHGWEPVSDEFVVPTAGPHRRMTRVV